MTSSDRLFYPAVFHSAEEGGFWITFPDFPECMTQGDDMAEAYRMAEDALGLAIEDRLSERAELPEAIIPTMHMAPMTPVMSVNTISPTTVADMYLKKSFIRYRCFL